MLWPTLLGNVVLAVGQEREHARSDDGLLILRWCGVFFVSFRQLFLLPTHVHIVRGVQRPQPLRRWSLG